MPRQNQAHKIAFANKLLNMNEERRKRSLSQRRHGWHVRSPEQTLLLCGVTLNIETGGVGQGQRWLLGDGLGVSRWVETYSRFTPSTCLVLSNTCMKGKHLEALTSQTEANATTAEQVQEEPLAMTLTTGTTTAQLGPQHHLQGSAKDQASTNSSSGKASMILVDTSHLPDIPRVLTPVEPLKALEDTNTSPLPVTSEQLSHESHISPTSAKESEKPSNHDTDQVSSSLYFLELQLHKESVRTVSASTQTTSSTAAQLQPADSARELWELYSHKRVCYQALDPGNYRPVSLTSILGKIVSKHTKYRKVTGSSQHGFTKGKSFLSDPIAIHDTMTSLVHEERVINTVYLYFPKGFDTVSHILIYKLMKLGGLCSAAQSSAEGRSLVEYLWGQYWGQYSITSSLIIWMKGQRAPLACLQMTKNWEWLIDQMSVLLFRGTSGGWRNGLTGTSLNSAKSNVKSYKLGRNNPMHQYRLGANQLDSGLAEKAMGIGWTS
ncbi:hypothetical protein QYF61_010170 [Mycteria americana]|uniref:Reverse transcriptase domain-containing protein n=1 Tax=Mycteria americana TaxID=33587 RepID=A0AAN7MZW2_MYCAM|nr:hypothetical protein QYF61_010170 [Mycteria americana]